MKNLSPTPSQNRFFYTCEESKSSIEDAARYFTRADAEVSHSCCAFFDGIEEGMCLEFSRMNMPSVTTGFTCPFIK